MPSRVIETNGTHLHYQEIGSRRPLVLLHGRLLDSRMWDDQVTFFTSAFRTICYDLRGHSQSGRTPGVFRHHDDLFGLLRTLSATPAFLIGHSLGARTAIDFAFEYPQAVRALVLAGPGLAGYPFSDQIEHATTEMMRALGSGKPEQAAEIFIRVWIAGSGRSVDQVAANTVDRVRTMIADNCIQPLLGEMQFEEPNAMDRLNEIHFPTLVVCGEQDVPDVLAIADFLESRIAGARKVLFPRVAHMPNMEMSGPFNRLVSEFLKTCE